MLSATIDFSIFDPHGNMFPEFFVALHEIMSNLEPRSTLAWGCVNVLTVACRNPSARQALIHTYQFLPPLTRLLSDNLIFEKKIRLLSLMQANLFFKKVILFSIFMFANVFFRN